MKNNYNRTEKPQNLQFTNVKKCGIVGETVTANGCRVPPRGKRKKG